MNGKWASIALTELIVMCSCAYAMEKKRHTVVCVGCTQFSVFVDDRYLDVHEGEKIVREQYSYEQAKEVVLANSQHPFADSKLKEMFHDAAMTDIDRIKKLFGNTDQDDVTGYAQWKKKKQLRKERYENIMCGCNTMLFSLIIGVGWLLL